MGLGGDTSRRKLTGIGDKGTSVISESLRVIASVAMLWFGSSKGSPCVLKGIPDQAVGNISKLYLVRSIKNLKPEFERGVR